MVEDPLDLEDLETEEDVVVGSEEIEEGASVIVVEMTEEMIEEMVTVEEEVVVSEDGEEVVAVVELVTTATMRDIWQETAPKETEEIEEDDRLILMGFSKTQVILSTKFHQLLIF